MVGEWGLDSHEKRPLDEYRKAGELKRNLVLRLSHFI